MNRKRNLVKPTQSYISTQTQLYFVLSKVLITTLDRKGKTKGEPLGRERVKGKKTNCTSRVFLLLEMSNQRSAYKAVTDRFI